MFRHAWLLAVQIVHSAGLHYSLGIAEEIVRVVKQNRSYGATTLENRHARVPHPELSLEAMRAIEPIVARHLAPKRRYA